MSRYESCSNLKDNSKGLLEGNWGIAALYTFALFTVVIAFTMMIALPWSVSELFLFGEEVTLLTTILDYIVSGIISIFVGVLNAGTALFFLNIACGRSCSLKDMFYCFSGCGFGKCLAISAGLLFPRLIFMFPFEILSYFFNSTGSWTLFGIALLVHLICMAIYLPINYALSMSFYLMLDFPQYSASKILKLSMKITKGHKRRLFWIDLSFLPLLILGYLSFGIGSLWITPYTHMVSALFFLDLMKPKNDTVSDNVSSQTAEQPYNPFTN